MKIHRVVTMVGATTTTGKLASDMYELGKKRYYSEAEGRDIPISHMDFQHMVRAFVKLCEQEDMLDRSKHMGTTKDLVAKIERLEDIIEEKDQDAMNTNKSWVDYAETLTRQKDMYKDMVKKKPRDYTLEEVRKEKDEALDEGVSLANQVENLKELLEEKDEHIDKLAKEEHRWRKAYHDNFNLEGHRYIFTEIPNNEYGKKLTRGMKVYLNDESYTMRVRGQHIKPELKGTGATYWGQSIEQSTHLRVYIDKK